MDLNIAIADAKRLRDFVTVYDGSKLKTAGEKQHLQNVQLAARWLVEDLQKIQNLEGSK